MILTINTDASWHSQTKIAGFAFWLVCDEYKFCHSGTLRKLVSRPEIAEFKCILNAIHVAGKFQKTHKKPKKIIVNTDCLNVIHLVKGHKQSIAMYGLASWGRHLVADYERLLHIHKFKKSQFDFRHVKSHRGIETKRQFVNDWCDKKAKEEMWGKVNKPNNNDILQRSKTEGG